MSGLKICRICLRTCGKMYKCDKYQLKSYYEEIMALNMNEQEGLPQRFCYECAALLYKFHKFKEKCQSSQKILKECQLKGKITYESIKIIDREKMRLKSEIDLITVTKNVLTCTVKHKKNVPKLKMYEIDVPFAENIDVDNQSITSFKNDENDYEMSDNDIVETNDTKVLDILNVTKVNEEKLSSNDEKLVIDLGIDTKNNNIDNNIIPKTTVNDENLSSDDDKTLIDIKNQSVIKYASSNVNNSDAGKINCGLDRKHRSKFKKDNKKRIKKNNIHETEVNQFRFETKKGKYLDANNWLKIYLSEEEAVREFKARAEDRKYLKAPFKCTDCFKGFSQQDMLDRHVKLRHVESLGPIECRFCKMRFKWKCYLTRHMPRHYTIYKCLRCNLVCRMETSAIFHEDYHNGVIRTCKHCGEEFKHLSTYYTHLRTHRSQHVCNLCGVSFVSEAGLHLHKLVKHIGAPATKDITKKDLQGDTFCSRCDMQFETKTAYEEHLFHSAMHSKGVEDLVEDTPAPACPKVRKKGMRTPRKPTTCSYCGKIFPTQSACMKHHHAEHPRTPFLPNEERHICEICGLSLAAVSVAHHLNTHTKERMYTCNTCGVQFNSKSSMNRHQLTHTGEKPFACSLCDKRFTQSNSVKLHYRTFHLKQPYPKRNRRRKADEVMLAEDFRTDESNSLTIDRWR